jgi:hypothetical protein
MIDAETFRRCDTFRKYLLLKGERPIFTFVLKNFPDETIGITIIEGTMKGYSIVAHDLWRFYGEQYYVKDCGEAPLVASVKIATAPGRPRTPE